MLELRQPKRALPIGKQSVRCVRRQHKRANFYVVVLVQVC